MGNSILKFLASPPKNRFEHLIVAVSKKHWWFLPEKKWMITVYHHLPVYIFMKKQGTISIPVQFPIDISLTSDRKWVKILTQSGHRIINHSVRSSNNPSWNMFLGKNMSISILHIEQKKHPFFNVHRVCDVGKYRIINHPPNMWVSGIVLPCFTHIIHRVSIYKLNINQPSQPPRHRPATATQRVTGTSRGSTPQLPRHVFCVPRSAAVPGELPNRLTRKSRAA